MNEHADNVLGVIVCDFEKSAIGTRSRLKDSWVAAANTTVLQEVIRRVSHTNGIGEIALVDIGGRAEHLLQSISRSVESPIPVRVFTGERRTRSMDDRVRIGRAWNLLSWRGGAGQWTVFDEEYHPSAIAGAMAAAFDGKGADHIFLAHSHGVLLDPAIAGQLIHHHLFKNHQTPFSYTPAAPGLCGILFPAEAVRKMGEHQMLPHQWLEYNPLIPTFDTLIRDACMQVDPALSKIPNRFCADTHRSIPLCQEAANGKWSSISEMCVAMARDVVPGVLDVSRVFDYPREVEVELTAERLTRPPGDIPEDARVARHPLDAKHWIRWFERHADLPASCDDLLLTIGGDGDPLLCSQKGALLEIVRAARASGILSICIQTDLAGGDVEGLLAAMAEGVVDVLSVTLYGHTPETYARVAGADLHATVLQNLGRIAEVTRARGGVPLVIPRLLKVRETIGEMEAFFDLWVQRCGWAVIDGPTDRAGAIPFPAVVDMAPPRRKPCRRLWNRLNIRADGRLAACDQDAGGKLLSGHIENMTIRNMWTQLQQLRTQHAAGAWNALTPCATCREWHRP